MKQAFLVTIETLKSAISQEELEVILYDELCFTYYHPCVDVVEITKPDPESDEEMKTVFRNARQSGKSLTMAGLK